MRIAVSLCALFFAVTAGVAFNEDEREITCFFGAIALALQAVVLFA